MKPQNYSGQIERKNDSTKSCLTLATLWTVSCQAPLSMGFSREQYWNGLPFPSPVDLSDPGIEPTYPALQADSLPKFFISFLYSPALSSIHDYWKNHGFDQTKLSYVGTNTQNHIPSLPCLATQSTTHTHRHTCTHALQEAIQMRKIALLNCFQHV